MALMINKGLWLLLVNEVQSKSGIFDKRHLNSEGVVKNFSHALIFQIMSRDCLLEAEHESNSRSCIIDSRRIPRSLRSLVMPDASSIKVFFIYTRI